MRQIGAAERAPAHVYPGRQPHGVREAPGREGVIQDWIAECRVRIEQAWLLVLKTAWLMDTVGNKGARTEIQAIKIVTPTMAEWVIDKAIQAHGGGGAARTSRWPSSGPTGARSGSPMGRTRCTRGHSPAAS